MSSEDLLVPEKKRRKDFFYQKHAGVTCKDENGKPVKYPIPITRKVSKWNQRISEYFKTQKDKLRNKYPDLYAKQGRQGRKESMKKRGVALSKIMKSLSPKPQ